MRRLSPALSALVFGLCLVVGCSRTKVDPSPAPAVEVPISQLPDSLPEQAEAFAYFAGGCFWGVEHYLEQMDGVIEVESGYMGGRVERPSYKQVIYERTGHLETVRVRYQPAKVSYEALTKRFFEIHDPTQADGQGPDIGEQYLSAIFLNSKQEERTARDLIAQLEARGFDVVTQLRAADKFWTAEEYHQNYYVKTGKQPYCHRRVKRFDEPVIER